MVLRLRLCRRFAIVQKMIWKIEKHSDGQITTIRLIGRMQAQHLEDLHALIEESKPPIALDLEELMLVDLEAVRFLGRCQSGGMSLLHCAQYVRHWITKEQGKGK
jgi:hypothetical protein